MLSDNPLFHLIHHHHQGIWNRRLIQKIKIAFPVLYVYRFLVGIVIVVDTSLLFIRSIYRRIDKLGFTKIISKPRMPQNVSILYFDLGLHEDGRELSFMVREFLPRISLNFKAYGFEASKNSYERAQEKFFEAKNVEIIHGALCNELPSNGKIRLYKVGDGRGSSIYRCSLGEYEEIMAMKLSDWLQEKELDLENNICLLRMNIEGSELDVIVDLVNAGLAKRVDGYFGMWDDMSEIDEPRDAEFRSLLAKNHISSFTFNERDFLLRLRIKCIEYELKTAILGGLNRLAKGLK